MGTSSGRDACSAGARPNASAVSSVTANANSSTDASMRYSIPIGYGAAGMNAFMRSLPHSAITTPTPPANTASVRLSVSSWRISRPRRAPTARRIAISRRRPAARASMRFATLAHAMSSTTAVIPSSAEKTGASQAVAPSSSRPRTTAPWCSCRPAARASMRFATLAHAMSSTTAVIPSSAEKTGLSQAVAPSSSRPRTTAPWCSLSPAARPAAFATASSSCAACAKVTPSLSRAMPSKVW
ncbi:MAG: hypothetical protein A2085_06560 [Gemmatimonadetes bacterium GWC2_71_10]|nr:MAG: hypothetical protein A2085_06560 [Gemmatimonadetes bacterium GWC2_71_10]